MSERWNLDDPRDAEAALAYFYSLPDDEALSEQDEDDNAYEELEELTESDSSVQDESIETITIICEEAKNMETTEPIQGTSFSEPARCNQNNEQTKITRFPNKKAEKAAADRVKYDTHLEWTHDTTLLDNLEIDHTKKANCQLSFESRPKEIDYFMKIFADVIEVMVSETNRYALQHLRRGKGSMNPGPSKNWRETDTDEIKALIGVFILMGIHRLPRLSNYWSSDPLLCVPAISQIMPSKRYKKLIENLHINNNETAVPKGEAGYDKLHKLRPLLDQVCQKSIEAYEPSMVFSVDESMIAFKGRSSFKQYMPKKPIQWGYKVWGLADASTSYIYFDVYTGKSDTPQEDGMTGEKVVTNLASVIKNKNCLVAFDNFFTTYPLMKRLLEDNTYAIGTVRSNRKGLPDMMHNKQPKLKRGEFMFGVKQSIAAVKWMDNNPVCFFSNYCSPKNTSTVFRKTHDGSKLGVSCPQVVSQYNEIMGGVDRFDQLRECYEVGRRSTKWWHRLFYYFLDMAIINAFILMKVDKETPKAEQLSFRINLARQLIGNYSSRKKRNKSVLYMSKKGQVPDEIRLTAVGAHLPNKINNYRRCRLCSSGHVEKRTRILCATCGVPLCLDPCFKKFHGR